MIPGEMQLLGSLPSENWDSTNREKVFEAVRVATALGFQVEARYVEKVIPAIPAVEGTAKGRPESRDISLTFFAKQVA